MTFAPIQRRDILKTALFGAGGLLLPGFALGASVLALRGFTHSVASGEPGATSMLLWTRYVPADGGAADVRAEVSATADFARIVGGGATITGPWRDYTAKVTVTGLEPYRRYFYRFIGPDGSVSSVGTTRTLPADGQRPWRAAIFSCANMGYGWFNAYGHAAARRDIDCAIHLGDYFYEYGTAQYPPAADAVAGRVPEPAVATVHVADYRLRYASYRLDPDLMALHSSVPMIAQWDDHESANDSWSGGAANHHPDTEGDWSLRRDAAMQVYYEWMPVSELPWKAYDIGGLATLFRTETRLLARTQQPSIADALHATDPQAALTAFRDGTWMDPGATMMGGEQEVWLAQAMKASARSGRPWQIVGFGTIMGKTTMPAEVADWVDVTDAKARAFLNAGLAAAKVGLPFNYDNWGGYPAARARFLRSAQAAGGNTVLISGDSHNAWAYNLTQDGQPVGVEFAGMSVTSPGYEHSLKTDPARVARALVHANPELTWCDTSRRGYMAMTVSAEQVSNEWIMLDTVTERAPGARVGHRATVNRGRAMLARD